MILSKLVATSVNSRENPYGSKQPKRQVPGSKCLSSIRDLAAGFLSSWSLAGFPASFKPAAAPTPCPRHPTFPLPSSYFPLFLLNPHLCPKFEAQDSFFLKNDLPLQHVIFINVCQTLTAPSNKIQIPKATFFCQPLPFPQTYQSVGCLPGKYNKMWEQE